MYFVFERYICVHVLLTLMSASAFDMSKLAGMPMMSSENGTRQSLMSVEGPTPFGLVILFMDEETPQQFNYTMECKDEHANYILKASSDDSFLVTFISDDVIIDCHNRTLEILPPILLNASVTGDLTNEESNMPSDTSGKYQTPTKTRYVVEGTQMLNFKGEMIGRTFITFKLYNYSDNLDKENQNEDFDLVTKFPVIIFRKLRAIDHIFQVVIYVFMVFVTLGFGCKLDLEVVKANLKNPIAPIIGMCCQFIIMPLLGYGIARIVTADQPDVALGIFVAACCPGGGASNIYSFLLGGDLSLSITMTALSTILALGMMPLWIYTLGQHFTENTVNVPFMKIFTTLLVLILPLFVGLLIQYKLPKVKKILMKIITPVTVCCIILLITVGIYSNLYIFKLFKPQIMLAGCLLPYFGYILGGLTAFVVRLPWERVKTVAIETGMQNTGIAIILMMFAFPPPDGFIAAVAPIASAIMTPLPLFVITIPYLIYRRYNKEKYATVPTENGKSTEMEKYPADKTVEVENGTKTVI